MPAICRCWNNPLARRQNLSAGRRPHANRAAPQLPPELLDPLRSVGRPTICNAIETAQGKRGFQGDTRDAEAIILTAARAAGFDFARFQTAWAAFEKART